MQGLAQFLSYTVTQVFSGSLSVGDNQYLLDGKIFFKKKPQYQAANGIGFTCTGTCINEVEATKGASGKIKGVGPAWLAGGLRHSLNGVVSFIDRVVFIRQETCLLQVQNSNRA